MANRKTGTKVNHQLSDPSVTSPSKISSILWYLAVIPSFWSFGFTTMWGSDLWWHIATGRWIVTHKALPLTDGWSFTRAATIQEAERDFRGALTLMPYMRLACDSLAQVQALQGKKQEALQSLDQCQRIFPDRDRASSIALLK